MSTTGKTLAELARLLNTVTPTECIGDETVRVTEVVHPRFITGPEDLILAIDPHALPALQHPAAHAAVITSSMTLPSHMLSQPGQGYLKVERARLALAKLLEVFDKPVHAQPGIHPSAVIESSAKIDPSVSVGALVYVGENAIIGKNTILMPHVTVGAEARIGEKCLLHPGVRIGERVILGNRIILHHNASIGADGFSFVTPEAGSIESAQRSGGKIEAKNTELVRINSIGTVVLEDDVEIGACTTVDRSNLGATLVKKGTKVDNLVMIAHNNTVGENCLVVAQAGIAGSCQIGDRVVIAGQAGMKDHVKIGDDAIIMAKAGLMNDVPSKGIVVGIPAVPQRDFFQQIAYLSKIKDMRKDIKELKARLSELESQLITEEDEETIAV